METLNTLLTWIMPVLITAVLTAGLIWLLHRILIKRPGTAVLRQLLTLACVIVAMILLVLVVPLEIETRGQLLSLFGLVLTAVIALASTSFVSNAMAGFMLRSVASFHPGDFIHIGEHFGRVTETALFHTEIQNEDRDLVTLPNLFLITAPVRVVRSSGTLISTTVSLGYDLHRRRIRDLLNIAAEAAGLADPFVQITGLGDFSVAYRVSGFLKDVGNLVSSKTELNNQVLDQLHQSGIEIVSPHFMNQRRLDPSRAFIPTSDQAIDDSSDEAQRGQAERLMFDKAELAGRIQQLSRQREALIAELKALKTSDDSNQAFEISWRERQIESLNEILATLQTEPFEIR